MEILETADSEYVRSIAGRHVRELTGRIRMEDLQAAVEVFRAARGEPPADLRELVRAGIVARIPVHPGGRPYRYDRST